LEHNQSYFLHFTDDGLVFASYRTCAGLLLSGVITLQRSIVFDYCQLFYERQLPTAAGFLLPSFNTGLLLSGVIKLQRSTPEQRVVRLLSSSLIGTWLSSDLRP
jgi:hypothetical protein